MSTDGKLSHEKTSNSFRRQASRGHSMTSEGSACIGADFADRSATGSGFPGETTRDERVSPPEAGVTDPERMNEGIAVTCGPVTYLKAKALPPLRQITRS